MPSTATRRPRPLYTHIDELSQLRAAHPALETGAQIERFASDGAGVYAFSRVDRDEKTEYLVALNNTTTEQTVSLTTLTAGASYAALYGGGAALSSDAAAAASVTVPALGTVVYKADRTVTAPAEASALTVSAPAPGAGLSGQVAVSADVADDAWSETSFAWRVVGSEEWTPLGTAEDTDPRVFHDIRGLEDGTLVEYRAVTTDAAGHRSAASTYASVGNAVTLVEDEEPEVPIEEEPQVADEYDFVSVAGSFNSEAGLPRRLAARVRRRADDPRRRHLDAHAPGPQGRHLRVQDRDGQELGRQLRRRRRAGRRRHPLTAPRRRPDHVLLRPPHEEHPSTADGPIITLAGSFQSELGCVGGDSNGDWEPSCLAAMMFDRNADGTLPVHDR